MEFLSDRVSLDRTKGKLSIVNTPRLPRWKEAVLIAWFLAWTFCGVYFIYTLKHTDNADLRRGLLAMIAFWVYFELRIGKAVLWRVKGFELIRIKDGVLTIKNSFWGFGKAKDHFVENITEFGIITIDKVSWKWQLNESFWVIGAERLGFTYMGRKVVFGKGLSDDEAQRVARELQRGLTEARKKAQ